MKKKKRKNDINVSVQRANSSYVFVLLLLPYLSPIAEATSSITSWILDVNININYSNIESSVQKKGRCCAQMLCTIKKSFQTAHGHLIKCNNY